MSQVILSWLTEFSSKILNVVSSEGIAPHDTILDTNGGPNAGGDTHSPSWVADPDSQEWRKLVRWIGSGSQAEGVFSCNLHVEKFGDVDSALDDRH